MTYSLLFRYTGYRNCIRCTAWRPVSDFPTYYSHPRGREYLSRVCQQCRKLRQRERYREFSPEQIRAFRERTREYAAARRRREGRPVRNMQKPNVGANRANDRPVIEADFKVIEVEMHHRGVTLLQLGRLSGVNERRLRDWKAGRHSPTLDSLDRVCLALDSTITLMYPDL